MWERLLKWIKNWLGLPQVNLKLAGNEIIRTLPLSKAMKRVPVFSVEKMTIEMKIDEVPYSAWVDKSELLETIEKLLHFDTEERIIVAHFNKFEVDATKHFQTHRSLLTAKTSKYRNKIELIHTRYESGKIYGLPSYRTVEKKTLDQFLNLVKSTFIETECPYFEKVIEFLPTLEFKMAIYYSRGGERLYED